jgi:hypothetical protein
MMAFIFHKLLHIPFQYFLLLLSSKFRKACNIGPNTKRDKTGSGEAGEELVWILGVKMYGLFGNLSKVSLWSFIEILCFYLFYS